jgi:hypothetical protein
MTAHAINSKASWVEGFFSSRVRSFWNWCSHERLRSTNQRNFPRPLPCAVRRLASRGFIPFF